MDRAIHPKKPGPKNRQPYLWLGMGFGSWVRLLFRNRLAISWSRWHIVLMVSVSSLHHSALGIVERLCFGFRIARARVHPAPVFILGHWRSGTTLLHELFACDRQLACPSTYDCFSPLHFLLTRRWAPRLLRWTLPDRRPMDNMAVGFDRPQEDEFALCLLGQPSPLAHVAFPNRIGPEAAELDVARLPRATQLRWMRVFYRFLQRLSLVHGEVPFMLKSPPHMMRIRLIVELFPNARFIFISRDPYDLFPSTLYLWRTMYAHHSLQEPDWSGLQERILATYEIMHDRFEADRALIAPGRLHQVRFEDLVEAPLTVMSIAYAKLGLGGFDQARAGMERYLATVKDYRGNQLPITEKERAIISVRWRRIFAAQGYQIRDQATPCPPG
jgi:omega-hydroxy-beta-dihydromenaquinone-9 sulfotransferase